MLEIKNVSVNLSINDRKLVENFNFTLSQGDKAVLIGEEGNGKSTLLKLIYDESLVEDYCQHSGQIIKKGRLAYLPQSFPEEGLDSTIETYFSGEEVAKNAQVLARLGLNVTFTSSHQLIRTLSGGEKIKIQLAKILFSEPDVLLLDEPTNDIDIATLDWLEGFIANSREPILFISHDETLIEKTANVIIHMEQLMRKTKPKITIARTGYTDYVEARNQAFDKQTQVARKQRADHKTQMQRWKQIHDRVDHQGRNIAKADRDFIGGRLKKKMAGVKATGKRLEKQSEDFLEIPEMEDAILTQFAPQIFLPQGKVMLMLELSGLYVGENDSAGVCDREGIRNCIDVGVSSCVDVGYSAGVDRRKLTGTINLTVVGPARIGIIGKNGTGKSTLLKKIWESLQQRADIKPAYMPQDYAEVLDYNQPVIDFLAADAHKSTITKVRTYLGSMKFTPDEMLGKIGKLSGGQKAKILFLDMVLKGANVLVLDEPTRNFSPLSAPEIRKTLTNFGGAIISVSHDRKYLEEVCDTVYELTVKGLTKVEP
ncbi:MAG: ATP-binding cassette domain-containing protein [Defluviitaleaceae bacterium]|nr:ATP-binding cassette domain-containing protein [Defluviitaleaceae bacterium]